MKNFLLCFSLFLASSCLAKTVSKMEFWNHLRRGTNFFNQNEHSERFVAAKNFGVEFVRLAPNKWLNGRPLELEGDFLIGRPGQFKGIVKADLKLLRKILDDAHRTGLRVVLTMLSVPEGRWQQHNGGVEERKMWESFDAQEKTISFWKELALELKDHPAIVGYNIRNEPSPELVEPKFSDWYTKDYSKWYGTIKNTPRDLNLFYRKVVTAIRSVDKLTPIVLDSGYYSTAWAFKVLEPIEDSNTLYSFHMYEPYAYNSRHNGGRYLYPGKAPIGEGNSPVILDWNRSQLEQYLAPISQWQKDHKIASHRILVGEVGVFRTNAGAAKYLKDITDILNEKQWHWAFYSFREDTWAGMDYELGTGKPHWKYWEAIEKGVMPPESVYLPNVLTEVLKAALNDKGVGHGGRDN